MRRLPRTHKKLAMSKEEEPDFYELEKCSPLPSLEEAAVQLEVRKVARFRDQLARGQQLNAHSLGATPSQLPFIFPPR